MVPSQVVYYEHGEDDSVNSENLILLLVTEIGPVGYPGLQSTSGVSDYLPPLPESNSVMEEMSVSRPDRFPISTIVGI